MIHPEILIQRHLAARTFLSYNANEWSAIGVWATGLATVGLLFYAARQLTEARRLRDDQTRPFLVVDFSFRSILVSIRVSNTGTTAAKDARVVLDAPVESTAATVRWQGSGLFGSGLPQFAPGRHLDFALDSFPRRRDSRLPMVFTGGWSTPTPIGRT